MVARAGHVPPTWAPDLPCTTCHGGSWWQQSAWAASLTVGLISTPQTMTLRVTHPSLTILGVCKGSVLEIYADLSDTWRPLVIHLESGSA